MISLIGQNRYNEDSKNVICIFEVPCDRECAVTVICSHVQTFTLFRQEKTEDTVLNVLMLVMTGRMSEFPIPSVCGLFLKLIMTAFKQT